MMLQDANCIFKFAKCSKERIFHVKKKLEKKLEMKIEIEK